MHPYRMQTLIKQRGKDQIANVSQRNSIYQTIDALRRADLIEVTQTSRDTRRPERTVYRATEAGRAALRTWVRSGLSRVAKEFPEFPAALATLFGVAGPDDLAMLLKIRAQAQQARLIELEKTYPQIPRVFLLEQEHMAAAVRAEIHWLQGVISDLHAGGLGFPTKSELLKIGAQFGGPSEAASSRLEEEMRVSPAVSRADSQRDKARRPGAGLKISQRKRTKTQKQ
jgi:DNA-binding PadR family transcriptional regulator